MNKKFQLAYYWFALLSICFFAVNACSLQVDQKNDSITDEDLAIVSQIIAESLSDANAGAVSAMHDAVSGISSTGFSLRKSIVGSTPTIQEFSGRGNETNIQYRYDAQIGAHYLSFDRFVDLVNYQKSQSDTLVYFYKDAEGNAISEPVIQASLIESIRFYGSRSGQITQPLSSSSYERRDTLLIRGLGQSSDRIYMDGAHNGSGFYTAKIGIDSSWVSRSYRIQFNFLDIQLIKDKPLPTQQLNQSIQGLITYSLEIADPSQPEVFRNLNGRIDLVGDGTAVLNVGDIPTNYQVNLSSGDSKNQEAEFEGAIKNVQPEQLRLNLANGITVQLSNTTRIDVEGDLFSLEEVDNALKQKLTVRAEGEGILENRLFQASSISFELEDEEDEQNDSSIEFEQQITAIDLSAKTLTLASGLTLAFDQNSEVDRDGDLISFGQVQAALNQGVGVEADGEAIYQANESIAFLITAISFDLIDQENDDNDDDDNGNNEGEQEINGKIIGIDLEKSLLFIGNNQSIRIDSSSVLKGDFKDLTTISNAIDEGAVIDFDATVITDAEGIANYLAIEIEFEAEEED
jgi:hypothetical protein